jgi:hypothetical protein
LFKAATSPDPTLLLDGLGAALALGGPPPAGIPSKDGALSTRPPPYAGLGTPGLNGVKLGIIGPVAIKNFLLLLQHQLKMVEN